MNKSEATHLDRKGTPAWGALTGRLIGLLLGVAPLLVFMSVFFFWPLWSVLWASFQDNYGAFSLGNYEMVFQEPYLSAFKNSIGLGLISAVTSSIPGAVLAYLIESRGSERLRRLIASVSSVLANTGGVPLAFMFIAAFGMEGSATLFLKLLGLNIYEGDFTLFSFTGIVFVYTYFQIPMMVIVFSPAVHGIRNEWQEAARNLGASRFQFWRNIGVPLIFPSFIASFLLLFASAFSAFATARAMSSGTIALVPLMIGNLVDGNVFVDSFNLGKALAMGMVVVSALAMIPYLIIQRRAARWQS
jgi:putative spermidine/putrescine transport system permease protein